MFANIAFQKLPIFCVYIWLSLISKSHVLMSAHNIMASYLLFSHTLLQKVYIFQQTHLPRVVFLRKRNLQPKCKKTDSLYYPKTFIYLRRFPKTQIPPKLIKFQIHIKFILVKFNYDTSQHQNRLILTFSFFSNVTQRLLIGNIHGNLNYHCFKYIKNYSLKNSKRILSFEFLSLSIFLISINTKAHCWWQKCSE